MAQARIQFRRGTAAEWTSANPTLAVGELGFETDTSKFKIGDGATAWTSLAYGFIPFTADSPITITDGAIGLDEGSITIAQSQVTGLETDLGDKQDVVSGVSDTEIGYLSGATSNIQTQIDGKQNIVTGVSDTEIGFLDGVTSAIQTQIDGKLSLTGGTLTGGLTLSADPSSALQAATKQYVDAVSEGLHIHASTRIATTENIDLSTGGLLEIDDIQLVEGDRVLVKDQTAPAENGIYVAAEGAWVRASDYNTAAEIQSGDFTFVSSGTLYEATGWVQTAIVTTLGTSPISWTQFSGAGTFVAGTGLTLTGNQFAADTTVLAPLASPSFSGTVVLPATTSIGDVSSTEIAFLDGVTSGIQTQLSGKEPTITGAATSITSANLTASRAVVSDGSGKVAVSAVTDTELGHVAGVTSGIQTQLNAKQATITGGATTITGSNLTANRALISDGSGKVAVSATTSTQLGFVNGVTSAIQTQLNGKSPLAGSTSITTVGTVTNVTSPTTAGSSGLRRTTISTADPTGGANGDVWLKYT
jgi:hypothetical protein